MAINNTLKDIREERNLVQADLAKAVGSCSDTIGRIERGEYSCAMKSHFRKIGNQMSGSGNHLCEFTRVMFYLDRIPLASICHVQHQCL